MFPIPLFPSVQCGRGGGQRSRKAALAAIVAGANSSLEALNWLAGTTGQVGAPVTAMQAEIRSRAFTGSSCCNDAVADLTSEAALRQLLRGSSPYSGDAPNSTLVAFNPDTVSVPLDVTCCPLVGELLPQADRILVEAPHERMLLPRGEVDVEDVPKPYVDPSLLHNRKKLYRLMRRMIKIGLPEPSRPTRPSAMWDYVL